MSLDPTEVRFKLKFGTIAGKWWGSKQMRPILLLHGWLDNAGSFDTLIPLLPMEFSYLAIDLPGHGLSSHYPDGCFYHINDMAAILEEIRLMHKWEKVSLIGHSMGALITFIYAAIFPLQVDFVCALDTFKPVSLAPKDATFFASTRMRNLYVLNSKMGKFPTDYTYDDIKERIYTGSLKSVDKDKVDILMKRGVKPSTNDSNRFQFTRDIRIKFINPLFIPDEITLIYIKRIRAAYLYIKTDDCTYVQPEQVVDEALQLFRNNNRHFEMIRVSGSHHVHLNDPRIVADKISEFIRKYYNNDYSAHQSTLHNKL